MPDDTQKRAVWARVTAWTHVHRWYVLAIALLVTALSASISPTIKTDADPTAYIPHTRKAVRFWLDLNKRFGVLTTLMVGLEEPNKPFTITGLRRLDSITKALKQYKAEGILSVRSLTNVQHMEKDRTGTVEAGLLLHRIPKTPQERKKAMKTVLNDMQVPGALISRNLRAYMILIQPDPAKDQRSIARLVEKTVEAQKGPLKSYYFGAPFITNEVTRDVYRKLPWIAPLFLLLLLTVLVLMVRHTWSVVLVLFSSGLALVWWLALMHVSGYALTMTNMNAILLLLVVGVLTFARGAQARLTDIEQPFITWALLPVGAIAFVAVAIFSRKAHMSLPYLALFSEAMALGLVAIALVWLTVFLPLSTFIKTAPEKAVDRPPKRFRQAKASLILLFIALFGVFGSMRIPFAVDMNDLFFKKGAVGSMLAFFDRNFHGHDFLQVSIKGDLRDPDTAARLMRATDLIEGTKRFADVRSITQVLGFLTMGFGNYYRIPNTRESLANVWFFLEGNRDVRPLVSNDRKEAMLALRLPVKSNPVRLAAVVRKALDQSALQGTKAARLRLNALLSYYGTVMPQDRINEVLTEAAAIKGHRDQQQDKKILNRIYKWFKSPSAPFQPTDEEWQRLATKIISDKTNTRSLSGLISTLASFKATGFPDKVATRIAQAIEKQADTLKLKLSVDTLMAGLFRNKGALTSPLKARFRGIFADLLRPHKGPGVMQATISGFPLVAPVVAYDLRRGLWITAGVLILLFLVLSMFLAPRPWAGFTGVIDGLLAALLTGALGWITGIGVDSGSATLYLVPIIAGIMLSPSFYYNLPFEGRKFPVGFALGLAAAGLSILAAAVLPVMRVGAVMAMGLACAVIITGLTRILWQPPKDSV